MNKINNFLLNLKIYSYENKNFTIFIFYRTVMNNNYFTL